MSSSDASSSVDVPQYETQFKPLSDDEETLYAALEILRERKNLYLVRWDGVDPETGKPWDPSWVPKHDCTNSLIHEWKLAKFKKAQARMKKHKRNDTLAHGKKNSTQSRSRTKSGSATATPSKRSPDNRPSHKASLKASSSHASPVVEIKYSKKHPRDSSHSEDDSTDEYEEPTVSARKKRRLSPPSRHEEEEEEEEGEEEGEEELDDDSHEVQPRNRVGKRIVVSSEGSDAGSNAPVDDDEPVGRNSSRGVHGRLQSTTQESSYGIPEGDGPTVFDEPRTLEPSPTPSLPSPHAVVSPPVKRAFTVGPETQPSSSSSQLQTKSPRQNRISGSTPPSLHKRRALEAVATSSHLVAEWKTDAPRELRPVPRISPSKFPPYLPANAQPSSRHKGPTPPNSQFSVIETFNSSTHNKHFNEQHRKKLPAYSQRQEDEEDDDDDDEAEEEEEEGVESDDGHLASGTQDLIEDDEEMPPNASDEGQRADGEWVAEAQGQRTLLQRPQKEIKRSSSDIISNGVFSNRPKNEHGEKGSATGRIGNLQQRAFSKPLPSAELVHDSLASSFSGFSHTTDKRDYLVEGNREDVEELGPEDAPDGHSVTPGPLVDVNMTASSPVEAASIEATGPWTQNMLSYSQLWSIKSPTKQLDKALGLLHRKSEEIDELEQDRKVLQEKVEDLQTKLSAAERQYGEVSATLDMERVQRAVTEGSPVDEERLTQLLQENERLNTMNKSLESDKDLLRDLYNRASDAHQAVLAENNALLRDNQSLREQATNGVKQAGMFWKAQVRTLETELARMRGTVKILTDQAQRTDDDVRRRAALLPMAQKDTLDALEKIERLKDRIRELGRENTTLRIEIKDWEDEAMARRKMEMVKRHEESVADELVWVCQWIDAEHPTKCAALFESREKLREHLYEVGHI